MPLIDTQDAVNAMYDLCESLDTENPHIDVIVDTLEDIAPAQKRKFNDMSSGDFENWLRSHGICNPCIDDSIPCDILPLLIDDAIEETVAAQTDITDEQMYKKAFSVACELLIGANLFGVTEEAMFKEIMEKEGIVSSLGYEKYILDNLSRLTGEDDGTD